MRNMSTASAKPVAWAPAQLLNFTSYHCCQSLTLGSTWSPQIGILANLSEEVLPPSSRCGDFVMIATNCSSNDFSSLACLGVLISALNGEVCTAAASLAAVPLEAAAPLGAGAPLGADAPLGARKLKSSSAQSPGATRREPGVGLVALSGSKPRSSSESSLNKLWCDSST